jgi:4-alpha-glucanotransferase
VRHGSRTARRGRWLRGPRRALFDAVAAELGGLPLIAEDLGHITPPVHRLRDELGLPGMHILQWAFGGRRKHRDALRNHREYAVVYNGTHDNDTAAGWWRTAPGAVRARVEVERVRAGIAVTEPYWLLVELTLSSRARLAVIQAQDVLGLGSEARMNRPATFGENWQWRLEPGELTSEHAARLREATRRWRRLTR